MDMYDALIQQDNLIAQRRALAKTITLLESTRASPWQIDWKTASFSYIGPQIEPLLGWPAGSWKLASDWAELPDCGRNWPTELKLVVRR